MVQIRNLLLVTIHRAPSEMRPVPGNYSVLHNPVPEETHHQSHPAYSLKRCPAASVFRHSLNFLPGCSSDTVLHYYQTAATDRPDPGYRYTGEFGYHDILYLRH